MAKIGSGEELTGLRFGWSPSEISPFPYTTRSAALAMRQVNRVAEGPGGILWIATDGGLTRFDGGSFSHFSSATGLPTNVIYDVCLAGDDLLLATDVGVLRFGMAMSLVGSIRAREPSRIA